MTDHPPDPTPIPFTAETLQRAFERIRDEPPRVCGATEPHVVHSKANGITHCANCFQLIEVEDTPEGKKVVYR